MQAVVASTGGAGTVEAGLALLAKGGNAVDAAVAAILAWPLSLGSAGVLLALGTGLGRGAALFPVRAPGFSLSRPRRLQLINGGAPAAAMAIPCTAQALTAVQTRWGTLAVADVSRAVLGVLAPVADEDAPHREALELLVNEGVGAYSKGTFGAEAARSIGPLAGGLCTRRDLIEARPLLVEADGPHHGLWFPAPYDELRAAAKTFHRTGEHRTLSIVAVDRRGQLAAASLDAGPSLPSPPPPVAGVTVNTLLSIVTQAQAKKVGQPLPLGCIVAAGGDVEQMALAGPLDAVLWQAEHLGPEAFEPEGSDLLALRRLPGGQVETWGAASVRTS